MGANCVASTSIGCLFCCKGCNAEKVRNTFTFIPPTPSYAVDINDQDATRGRIRFLMEGLRGSNLYRQAAEASEVRWVTTRRGFRIPIVWIRRRAKHAPEGEDAGDRPGASASKDHPLVLLHCHGNATDIGMMMGPYFELSQVLAIEVVGVEYSGYGSAEGRPSAGNTYADIEAAYDLLTSEGVPPNRIVAYGQSVGSGPVANLAAKRQLGGVILHSPLLSGIKVIDPQPDSCCRPSCVWRCFDFYPNDRRIATLTCPVFIMHGQRDDIIPFYHGYRLHKACQKTARWPGYFPARAGHNDLVEADVRVYFGEISNFLLDVKRIAEGAPIQPPAAKKPSQVEMAAKLPAAASVVGRATPGAGAEPEVVIDTPAGKPTGPGDFLEAVPRPVVGPEDGRYEQLRRGNWVDAAVPQGQANIRR